MLVKCMLPISIVENSGFKEFINYLDPCFNLPTRYTIKKSGLTNLKNFVDAKNIEILSIVPWVNVSCDGWSDETMRCWNGYYAQGIDNNWEMQNIPIAFKEVKGNFLYSGKTYLLEH